MYQRTGSKVKFDSRVLRYAVCSLEYDLVPCNFKRYQEKFTEAVPLLERALSIRTKKLGDNHPDTVSTHNGLEVVRKEACAQLGSL